MIRGFQYLTHTRPDIENIVGTVARFQADPKEYHFAVVKIIVRYFKEAPSDFTLCAYTNVDWGRQYG